MGLFSSKKKIMVSSSLYNLAGDVDERIQFLPSAIATAVVTGSKDSVGETITKSLLDGPGIKFRSYARWARNSGYTDSLGMETGVLNVGDSIDINVLQETIPHAPDEVVAIQTATIGGPDYGYWADRWMTTNHPEVVDRDYLIDFDEVQNVITMTFPNGVVYAFTPEGFDYNSTYLYVSYMLTKGRQYGDVVLGNKTYVNSQSDLPSTSGWDFTGSNNTPKVANLVNTVTAVSSYSDGRPNETTTTNTPRTENYIDVETNYEKEERIGLSILGLSVLAKKHYQINYREGIVTSSSSSSSKTEDIGGGVIKTTVTTTTVQSVSYRWAYRTDDQDVTVSSWSNMKVLIYQKGSGNTAYDAMFSPPTDLGSFVPFVPIRQWNTFLSESFYPDVYEQAKKAIKRATNKDYQHLVDQLAKSPDLGDIDFAYCVFGVSLNTKENACKKYIYKFFEMVGEYGVGGDEEYRQWKIEWNNANIIQQRWVDWVEGQKSPTSPLFGTPEPDKAVYPTMPSRRLVVQGTVANFRMDIAWSSIVKTQQSGLVEPGAKVGKVWIKSIGREEFDQLMISGGITDYQTLYSDTIGIYYQDQADSYKVITVSALAHTNTVYKGKAVGVWASEALRDPEESGFIIPLHEGIYREISLKDATQMATACSYMVCNSYTVVKQKWYASSWFKVVLIIIAIVISVLSWGTASGPAAALVAATTVTAAAVAIAQIIATLVINAVLASLLMKILAPVATAIFGEEVGAVVAAIASVVVSAFIGGYVGGGSTAAGIQQLQSAGTLIQMTNSAVTALADVMNQKTANLMDKMNELQTTYQTKMDEISEAWKENLGQTGISLDLSYLTDPAYSPYLFEKIESFLGRTLMTGSDIATITNGMIGEYTNLSLTLDLA